MQVKLGLGNPPEPIYIYVGQGESPEGLYVWYHFDVNREIKTPVRQRALTGYLQELRLTSKEFKGKDNMKLELVVSADELYVIRTGIETNFSKTVLLALSLVEDFKRPLTFAAMAGEENTVFCRLYDAETKQRYKAEWNPSAEWASIIEKVQGRIVVF